MAEKPSMMDKVPSQLNEEDLKAEMDVEVPEGIDTEEMSSDMDIEVIPEEDGSVVVDFDPRVVVEDIPVTPITSAGDKEPIENVADKPSKIIAKSLALP